MTFNSKRTITSMVTGVVLMIGYLIYALGEKAPALGDIKSWAISMLIFIGIAVGVQIIIMILFQILYAVGVAVKERDKSDAEVERIIESTVYEDERDKLISLKSNLVGNIIGGIGVVGALVLLALGYSVPLSLNVILLAYFSGTIIEGCVSIYHYERGV